MTACQLFCSVQSALFRPAANSDMPNIATLLKQEIRRIARKEIRGETLALKTAVRIHRAEIAVLKRRAAGLEQQLRRVSTPKAKAGPIEPPTSGESRQRFTPSSLTANRRRLGLSARECGLLVGVSAQSIYNWEERKARPQAKHMPAILALRTLKKRDAAAYLARLHAE